LANTTPAPATTPKAAAKLHDLYCLPDEDDDDDDDDDDEEDDVLS
jgi:hypothetical protein